MSVKSLPCLKWNPLFFIKDLLREIDCLPDWGDWGGGQASWLSWLSKNEYYRLFVGHFGNMSWYSNFWPVSYEQRPRAAIQSNAATLERIFSFFSEEQQRVIALPVSVEEASCVYTWCPTERKHQCRLNLTNGDSISSSIHALNDECTIRIILRHHVQPISYLCHLQKQEFLFNWFCFGLVSVTGNVQFLK